MVVVVVAVVVVVVVVVGCAASTATDEPRRVQRESTDRRFEGLAALETEARAEASSSSRQVESHESTASYPQEEE